MWKIALIAFLFGCAESAPADTTDEQEPCRLIDTITFQECEDHKLEYPSAYWWDCDALVYDCPDSDCATVIYPPELCDLIIGAGICLTEDCER